MARGRFGIRTSGGSNSRASFGDCGPQWALAAVPRLHLHTACSGCSAGASLASGPSWTSRNLDLWRSELLAPFGRPFLFVTEHFLFLSQVVKKGSVEKGCWRCQRCQGCPPALWKPWKSGTFVDGHATGCGRLETSEMYAGTSEAVEVGDIEIGPSPGPCTLSDKGKSI